MALPSLIPELSPRGRRILAAILAFAAVARIAYLALYASDPYAAHPIHDAERYDAWARAWASGASIEPGPFYQAPLYPFVLSLLYRAFGPGGWAAYILQSTLGIATILLVARLARRAYGEAAALASAALAAAMGTFIFYETKLLPASLATFLAALLVDRLQAAFAADGRKDWAIAGVVLGAGALANPGMLLAAPVIAVARLLDRGVPVARRLAAVAVFAAGAALVVLPVTATNAARGEAILISANGGMTFWHGNNPNAVGVYSTPDGFSGTIRDQRAESRALAEAEAGRPLTEGEISSFWFRKGLRFLADDPMRTGRLIASKLAFALANEEQPLEYAPRLDTNPARWLTPIPFAVVLGLAVMRIGRGRRVDRNELPLLLVLGSQLGLLLAFYVSARYRLPAMPMLLAVAGAGFVAVHFDSKRIVAGVLVSAASFAYVPLAASDLRRTQDAMSACDRGAVLATAGRRDEAIASYRRAAALDPTYPYAHLDLARQLRLSGDLTGAEAAVREAVRLAPDLAEGWFVLGLVLHAEGRPAEAVDPFSRAFRLSPSVESGNNLAGILLMLGRGDEAIPVYREMKAAGIAVDPSIEGWMSERGATRLR